MPYQIEIKENGRLWYCRGTGTMLGPEVIAAVEGAVSSAAAASAVGLEFIIIDLRELVTVESSPEERRRLVDLKVELSHRFPNVALLGLAATLYQFGLARMWEQLLAPTNWDMLATKDLDEAREWLRSRFQQRGLGVPALF